MEWISRFKHRMQFGHPIMHMQNMCNFKMLFKNPNKPPWSTSAWILQVKDHQLSALHHSSLQSTGEYEHWHFKSVLRNISCPLLLYECYSGRQNHFHGMLRTTQQAMAPQLPMGAFINQPLHCKYDQGCLYLQSVKYSQTCNWNVSVKLKSS